MKKLQILVIVFLISLSVCALASKEAKACEYITVTQTANGQITPGTTSVEIGDTPSFTIIPDANYHIASITANGQPVLVTSSSGQSYQFSPISGDGTLTATFTINTYTITVTQTANGQITPGTTTVNYGAGYGFAINPDAGYYIASITTDAGGISVTSPSGQTVGFSHIQADHTITATFAAIPTPSSTPSPTPTAAPTSTPNPTEAPTPTPIPTASPSQTQTPPTTTTPTTSPTTQWTPPPTLTPSVTPTPTSITQLAPLSTANPIPTPTSTPIAHPIPSATAATIVNSATTPNSQLKISSAPEFPTWIIIALFAVIVMLLSLILIRKRIGQTDENSQTPKEQHLR